MNNVSCVMFHAKQDIIVSNSEDKSIRVWDATKRTGIQTFRREHDRFWILAAHPEMNLLAAGHDSGMIVFKLERERPAFAVSGDCLFYTKDRFLRSYEFSTQKETQILPIRRPGSVSLNQSPKTLSYSPSENAFLLCSDVDGGSYELYSISKDSYGRGDVQDTKKGHGGSAVFVARNRFAVLDKSNNQVLVKNLKNDLVKKSVLPIATDAIFYAGTGNLLCRSEDRVVIFDLQQRLVIGELQTPFIKYVVWSNDMENVALLSKHAIIIASKKLVHQCTLHETIRVKSGGWDDNGVFIYTTLNHIKYCLPNGDSGIIKTLDVPIYITKVSGNILFCLDRDGKSRAITIDATEYIFKLSLLKKRYDHVMNMIRNSQLCGQAVIAYLQQKGFPEIAVASATAIDEKDHWYRLGVEALRQGNAGIVEYAYQRTKNFERLSFLYLVTGNMEKLSKMLKIAEVKNDVMGQFHNALYMGDVRERIKILENVGHLPLAYITASVHGLHDVAERLAAELGDNVPSLPEGKVPSLLIPPSPVLCGTDWPLLRVMRGIFDGAFDNSGHGAVDEEYEVADGDWGEELDIVDVDGLQNGDIAATLALDDGEVAEENDEEGGWEMEDLELPPEADTPKASISTRSSVFVPPVPGMPVSQIWIQKSSLAADHAAAGNFDTAMRLLNRQLGIRNFAPLKSMFLDLNTGSHSYLRAFSSAPIISLAVERGWTESSAANVRGSPVVPFKLSQLDEKLKAGYKLTTAGKFTEALRTFVNILHTIPLIVVESRREVDDVKELVIIVKEYVLALQMELKRREIKDNPARQQELAAYFTHCNLQTPHLRLALHNAMVVCFKAKNLATASTFARRLLETNPTVENQAKTARQVIAAAEKNMTDATQLNYDFRNPFVVCGATYVPIYRGQKDVSCPYCTSRFVPSQEGQLCTVCDLAVVGADASGLLCSPSQIR
ncbi:WD40/YVTN repeat-like-containing domain superfamily [Sesbania bispinosa]|nr:WD40/YVTN repeat-like-containing domain superfamily [Sesbania bispinosa]